MKIRDTALLNYIITLCITDILNEISKQTSIEKEITIKPPNDVLIDGRKISGVLVEIYYPYAVLGIGINLIASPLEKSTDILKEFNRLVSPVELGENLYERLLLRIKGFNS